MNRSLSTESQAQLARVARGGALNLVGAAVAAISGFALVVVVARAFSPTTAGVLFASTSVFLVVVSLAVFGADTGLIQFVLRFEETGRSADIPTVLRCARRPVFATSVGIAVAVLVLAAPLVRPARLGPPSIPAVLRVLAVSVPFAAMAQLSLGETRAIGRMRPTVLIDNIFRTAAQTVAAAVVGVLGGGLLLLSIGWALPYVVSAALADSDRTLVSAAPEPTVGQRLVPPIPRRCAASSVVTPGRVASLGSPRSSSNAPMSSSSLRSWELRPQRSTPPRPDSSSSGR